VNNNRVTGEVTIANAITPREWCAGERKRGGLSREVLCPLLLLVDDL